VRLREFAFHQDQPQTRLDVPGTLILYLHCDGRTHAPDIIIEVRRQETERRYEYLTRGLCPEFFSIQPNCVARTHYVCYICFIMLSRPFSDHLYPTCVKPIPFQHSHRAFGSSTLSFANFFIVIRE